MELEKDERVDIEELSQLGFLTDDTDFMDLNTPNEESADIEKEEQGEKKDQKEKNKQEKEEEDHEAKEVLKQMEQEFKSEETKKPKPQSSSQNNDVTFSALRAINALREENIIDFDDPEEGEEPFNEEEAMEILKDSILDKADDIVEDKMKGLSSFTKSLLKYELDGGDPMVLLSQMKEQQEDLIKEDMDLSEEANQKLVMREMLKKEGYDEDEISSQLEYLEDSGRLEKFAKKKYAIWEKDHKEAIALEMQKQREKSLQQEAAFKKQRANLQSFISESDSIGEMSLSSNDKKQLTSYLMDRVVKTKNGPNISNFHADLGELLQNEKACIQLAKLLRSRNKDGLFSFDQIKKAMESKVTDSVRQNLRRNNNTIPQSKGGRNEHKSLADYF